jgi:hypothetical protein
MAAVEDLATRRASGVLEITGSPSGVIYLDEGHIAFARASWVPGLAARVGAARSEAGGPARGQQGDQPSAQRAGNEPLASRNTDEAAVAESAVRAGHLTAPRVHELITSIVVDAFMVLTIPLAADSQVAAIRFTSTRTYWTEMFPRLGIGPLRGEAYERAERMAQYGLSPTTPVSLRSLSAPSAVVTRKQWAVACHIGQHASARDLAMRRGDDLSDTVECLGRLIRAGLCTPVRVPVRECPPARVPAQGQAAGLPPAEHLPVRHQEHLPVRHTGHDAHPRQLQPAGRLQAPSVDVLTQVLNGLRKLS